MSVWLYTLPMTKEQEQELAAWNELPLPFKDLPDLSGVHSVRDMQQLLRALTPDAPPETIVHRADALWKIYSQLALEDLIVIPLMKTRGFALAEITSPYRYHTEEGKDIHLLSIKWHSMKIRWGKLALLVRNAEPGRLQLVEHAEQRKLVYKLLDRPYNRFVKLGWLVGFYMILHLITMAIEMINRQ